MRELIKDYKAKVLITLARGTKVCYTRHLKRIENRFGPLGVREVESADIVALIEDCKLTWVAFSTRNRSSSRAVASGIPSSMSAHPNHSPASVKRRNRAPRVAWRTSRRRNARSKSLRLEVSA